MIKKFIQETTKGAKRVIERTSHPTHPTPPVATPTAPRAPIETNPTRSYATLSSGTFQKSSATDPKKHPQVVQKDYDGKIIVENKRAGLTHSEHIKPEHAKKLPPVLKSYYLGKDVTGEKNQYCVHYDSHYGPEELQMYKENPEITKYLNENSAIRDTLNYNFAEIRADEHRKEMIRLNEVSDKEFAALEERLRKIKEKT